MTQPPVQAGSDVRLNADVDMALAPGAPEPAPQRASIWEDFLDIFYAPAAVFARRERGSAWVPIVVVMVMVGVFYMLNSGVLEPVMDAEFRRSIANAPNARQLSGADLERARGFAMTMGRVIGFVSVPIAVLLIGTVLWLAGKVVGARQTLHAAIVVAAYSYVPKALEAILVTVQGLLMDPATLDGRFRLSLGPARFLDPDSTAPALLAFVGRLDIVTIWVTVLLAIGLAVTGRIPRSQAAIAAALVWLIGAIPTVVPALLS